MLPIETVTLFEDRAQLLRRGPLELEAGERSVVVPIPAAASNRSLQARCEGAEVLDVRVRRRTEQHRPEVQPLRDEVEAAQLACQRARTQLQELQAQSVASTSVADLLLEEVSADVGSGRMPPSGRLRETLERLHRRAQHALEERLQAAAELQRLETELSDREGVLQQASKGRTEQLTEAVVRLRCSGGPVVLSVEVLVPGACWRPWHRARLVGGRLRLETEACVWQATGEDWSQVELLLSTERASLGADPPSLGADRLRARKTSSEVQVAVREQARQDLGPGGTRKAAELGGIDDGGEAVTLRALKLADVPSDGRPTRVPLFAFEVAATTQLLCAAEQAAVVLLRSQQKNEGRALLPGPVDLVRDGAVVGQTWLDYTAAGADFELGWGPEGDLRAVREVSQEHKEARMLSSWRQVEHRVVLKLSNVGLGTHTLELLERVPVSEVEKVKVETDLETVDDQGFVRWALTLGPGETAERELRYRMKLHSDVSGV